MENEAGRLEEFVERLIKEKPELVWQMLEGRPPQDLNLGQNPDLPFTIKIEKIDGKDGKTISEAI